MSERMTATRQIWHRLTDESRAEVERWEQERAGLHKRNVRLETQELSDALDLRDTELERERAAREAAERERDERPTHQAHYLALIEVRDLRAENQRLREANRELREMLDGLVNVATQYLDTGRGDLDGWIERAREALAASPGLGRDEYEPHAEQQIREQAAYDKGFSDGMRWFYRFMWGRD